MDVVRLFDWWRLLITPERPGWRKKVESRLLGTKKFSYFLIIFLPTTFMGALQNGLTVKAVMTLRLPISLVPCFAAGCFFGFKRDALDMLFKDAIQLSSQLCANGVPHKYDDDARRLLKLSRIGYRQMHTWTTMASLSIPVSVALQGKVLIEMWPWFDGDLGLWLGGAFQTAIVYPMAFPVYALSIYIWSIVEAFAVLFNILAEQLAESSTHSQVRKVACLHSELVGLSGRVAQQIELVLTVLTMGVLMTPALSTVLVVRGFFDLFCAASMPYLLVFYVLCRSGQNLENASFRLMHSAVIACSKGQEELTVHSRTTIDRILLLIMTRAMGKQSITIFRGNLRYNLRTCHEALRSWYSILQYLLNMPDSS